jgi:hypothetical protein
MSLERRWFIARPRGLARDRVRHYSNHGAARSCSGGRVAKLPRNRCVCRLGLCPAAAMWRSDGEAFSVALWSASRRYM